MKKGVEKARTASAPHNSAQHLTGRRCLARC